MSVPTTKGMELDTENRHPDAEQFFRDIALCVTTYRGGGPAMVWPAGAAAVVGACDARPPDTWRAADGPPSPPAMRVAMPPMQEMADHLSGFVHQPVHAWYWNLGAGQATTRHTLEHDAVLLQTAGSCECRVTGGGPDRRGRTAVPSVRVRLRAGEALYVARHGSYSLADVYSNCTLVQFQLRG
jgi:hypothetical protein